MDEQVYLDEILALQKEVAQLRRDNARLLSILKKYINKELKQKKTWTRARKHITLS